MRFKLSRIIYTHISAIIIDFFTMNVNRLNLLKEVIMNSIEFAKLFLKNKYNKKLTQDSSDKRHFSDMFLQDFIEVSKVLLNVEAISLFVTKEKEEEIYAIASAGAGTDDLNKITIKFGIGIVGHTAKERVPIISNNPENDVRFNRGFDRKTGFRTKNLLSFPVIIQEKPIAIIEFINKFEGEFGDSDIAILTDLINAIKDFLHIAIKNNSSLRN